MAKRLEIHLSDDALEAELTIDEGKAADLAALETILAKAKITEGLDRSLLTTIGAALEDAAYTLQAVIATGRAAEPGIDGKIIMTVKSELQAGEARPDGSVDYRDRHSLITVYTDDPLGRIQPPTMGQDGITVTGKTLPAQQGKEARIALGPGVELENQEFQAKRDGVLSYIPGKRIDVVRLIEHKADVDYASGNLDAQGSIIISGDIHPGFSVVASDDVVITGSVDDSVVFAGNSIVLAGGAMGKGTELVAKSDIDCRHARESRLLAGGTITIGDHCVNSRLAAESIYAVTGRGTVVGGEVFATRMISLREAGSRASVKTILAVAVSEARRSSLARLWQDMEGCDQETVKAPAKQGGKEGGLSLKESERIAEEQRVLLQEKQQLLAKARIEISGTAHTGVRIRLAEHELVIKEPLQSPVFVFDQQANCIVLLGG